MKTIAIVSCIILLISLAGCGGKPFNVQPRPVTPPAISNNGTEVDDLTIQAEAVMDESFLYDTFDANLILAGILPVRVKLTNSRAEPFEIKRARFEIRATAGRAYKHIRADQAYKRLVSYYGISTYSKDGYKQSRSDFASHGLDTSESLGAGESRQGILFFPVPDDEIRAGGLTFIGRRLEAKESKSKAEVEIGLD